MGSFESVVSESWWALVLRGIAAMLFGVLAFLLPVATLRALVLLFGAFALVDGIAAVILGIKQYGDRERWWATLIVGIVSALAGIITFLVPEITAFALLFLIAYWAIIRGVFEVAAAIRLRDAIEGEWLLALAGMLSIALGLLMLALPGVGVLALVFWIGAFAFVSGIVLIALGFRLRGIARSVHA